MPIDIIRRGLDFAARDYMGISKTEPFDVKPKEDQIKCGLYRALAEANFLVHVEAACPRAALARNGARCDLLAIKRDKRIAIEIKTAWAADGWVNKPEEQATAWEKDIAKLRALHEQKFADAGLFVLCLAFQAPSRAAEQLREKIIQIVGDKNVVGPFGIQTWRRLNNVQFFVSRVFG